MLNSIFSNFNTILALIATGIGLCVSIGTIVGFLSTPSKTPEEQVIKRRKNSVGYCVCSSFSRWVSCLFGSEPT